MRDAIVAAIVIAAAFAALTLAEEPPACFDAAGYEKATRTILCDCGCHPQSVHDCACGRAAEMRDQIRAEMTRDCLSGDALIARYVDRFGEQVRVAPTATGFNLVAWLGPLVALLGATVGMFLMLRRWSRRRGAGGDSEPPPPPPSATSEAYRDRLRDALEGME